MKVSIGMKLQLGAWGGGNQFGNVLAKHLKQKGINVCFDLSAPDIDLILLTEPRKNLAISAFNDVDIVKYLFTKNKRALVVHRINECDERKGTIGVNRRLIQANLCADYTVFVASWLRELFLKQGLANGSSTVILNGSDRDIFNPKGHERWAGRPERLQFVTHHWGANWLKGFDIYQRFDQMLGTDEYKERFSLTYIGNLPEGFEFKNALYVLPKHGIELADLLRQHHVYLTASQNEPGGNHQNEGANCGLPLLFRESGCMPEYCTGYGISFNENNFDQKLDEMADTYDIWAGKMKNYPHTADRMCEQYYQLFIMLLNNRDKILARRKWSRHWLWLARTIVSK